MTQPESKMYRTIKRSSTDVRYLNEEGWETAQEASFVLGRARRVFAVGTGTSYHAALNAGFQLRAAGCDAIAISSEDFVCFPPAIDATDAVMLFAHTGTTRFSAAALARAHEAGAGTVVVTAIEADPGEAGVTYRTVAKEESAAYTASHTAALFATAQLASLTAVIRGDDTNLTTEFERFPDLFDRTLSREEQPREMAAYALERRTFCAGAGPDAPLALEASLKARETAYLTIDALPAEQFIHGPMVTLGPDDFAILVATHEAGRPRMRELLSVLDRIGLRSWVIGALEDRPASATVFRTGSVHPYLAPILALPPIQLFACYAAHLKGTNADSFREDVAPYGEAFGLVRF